MSHAFLSDARFYQLLFRMGQDLAAEVQACGCRFCGGVLHSARYSHKSSEFMGELRVSIKEGGRRTQEQATQLMSDYYQADKNILPVSIKHKREEIIALLMDGVSEEEAFF